MSQAVRSPGADWQLHSLPVTGAPLITHQESTDIPATGRSPDPRFAIRRWREGGSHAALPVVLARATPLEFREWWAGAPMATGVYDIPYPVDTPVHVPDVVLAPVNGFDAHGYRLGYGGGYFDRTLASYAQRPLCTGLGFETARTATLCPRGHDMPPASMVTEAGIHQRLGGRLIPVDTTAARALADQRPR